MKKDYIHDRIIMDATITVGGLSSTEGLCPPELHRNPNGNQRKGGLSLMSIIDFIAVVSFGLTCFGLGYSFGKDNNKTQK